MRNSVFTPILIGFVLWSVAFLGLYGAQATGCRLGWHEIGIAGPFTLLRAVLVALFAIFSGLLLAVFLRHRRATDTAPGRDTAAFTRSVAFNASAAAGFSTLFCFAGVLWLTLC